MKSCHPDRAPNAPFADVKELTQAMGVLRHPAKRALHDAHLDALERSQAQLLHQNRLRLVSDSRAARAKGRMELNAYARRRGAACTLLLLVSLGAVAFLAHMERGFTGPGPEASFSKVGRSLHDLPAAPVPIVRQEDVTEAVDDVAWIAVHASAQDARAYSNACIAQVQEDFSLSLFDRCLAFEVAAQHVLGEAGTSNKAVSLTRVAKEAPSENKGLSRLGISEHRISEVERMTVSEVAKLVRQ